MRRVLLVVSVWALAVVMFAPAARASAHATREAVPFDYSFTLAAGEACDFAYEEEGYGWFNDIMVGSDQEVVAGGKATFVHTNLDTGEVLTEKVMYNDLIFYERGRVLEAGLTWHLRDAEGNLVLVHAGLVVWDLDNNVLKVTPNAAPDLWAVLCPALGGEVA